MKGPRYICVHGHFYQPPRENPWLEAVERQESAWPAHDWNARVTEECYAPNAHARILDAEGRITAIVNNYARISFNVGPTLMSWLETERPDVHDAIVDADRQSMELRGGHGAAMAQVYNHTIFPLASRRDKVTQVRWGIADFVRRYGRRPDGMWLAETACDTESLEVLAEEGIRFTVLAPHQCARVRRPGGEWLDVSGQRVDPRRAYVTELPSGKRIALFFYDGPISRGVAFERLLDDGYRFAERLMGAFEPERDEPQLVHIATDGETYGHHHAYGEMALAVALSHIEADPDVRLTNYAEFLELHPPTWEAQIAERTSWSCAHGIERWRADCGCNSGTGWHQRWRAPLREALDWLRAELDRELEEAARELLPDVWAARDAYIGVVLDRSEESRQRFFDAQCERALTPAEVQRALELLELSRHAMLMYTSSGWFFDELSDLSTIQVLQYAGRAVQLATGLFGDRFELGFRERLAAAPSNRRDYGDGERIYDHFVQPSKIELSLVGAHLATKRAFESDPGDSRIGGYEGTLLEHDLAKTGGSRLAVGRLRVCSRITTEAADFSYAVLHFGDHNLMGGIRPFGNAARHVGLHGALSHPFGRADLAEVVRQIDRLFEGQTFSLRHLLLDDREEIMRQLLADRTRRMEERVEALYDQTAPLIRFLESVDLASPPVFGMAAEYTLRARLRAAVGAGLAIDLVTVSRLIADAKEASVALDPVALGRALQETLEQVVEALAAAPEDLDLWATAAALAEFVAGTPWQLDPREAQNGLWRLWAERLPVWRARGITEDPHARERERQLLAVAAGLGFRV
ncbi:MAG: DUF3536 domain-containing protein [Sandaracinaceae bacterium]